MLTLSRARFLLEQSTGQMGLLSLLLSQKRRYKSAYEGLDRSVVLTLSNSRFLLEQSTRQIRLFAQKRPYKSAYEALDRSVVLIVVLTVLC